MISNKIALGITVMLVSAGLAFAFAAYLQNGFHGVGVLKSADSFAYFGDTVTYQIKVYNPSDYDLHNINISDPMAELNTTIPFMSAGNLTGVTYTFDREVLETDPNPLVNTVFVEAVDSDGVYSTASTQAITIIAEHVIDIQKSGPSTAHRGDSVKYIITVNNTQTEDLKDVIVTDELLGFAWQGDLAAAEFNIFNLTYVIPCDVEETLTNTATVSAEINETTIYAEAAWTTEILHPIEPHSKGYWKNHPEDWPVDEIEAGDITYSKEDALQILNEADSKDATKMLAAQLIAAKLNRISGASPTFPHEDTTLDIDHLIEEADAFLSRHPLGSDPREEQRETALHLKEMLDKYNNTEFECE